MTSLKELTKTEKPKDFVCDFCGHCEIGKGYLQRHIDRRHRKFWCNVCENVYSQKINLLDHLRSHFERFICQYCGDEIYRFEQFQRHVYQKHEPNNKQLILSIQPKESYKCRHCIRSFLNVIQRNSHESIVHKGRSEDAFKCEACQASFITKEQLRTHSFEHYVGTLHFCVFSGCDRFFKTTKQLKHHGKIHGPALYKCDKCQQKFFQSSNYSKHKKRCKGQPKELSKELSKDERENMIQVAKNQFLLLGGKLKRVKEDDKPVIYAKKPTSKSCRKMSETIVVEYLEEYLEQIKPEESTLIDKKENSIEQLQNKDFNKKVPKFELVFIKDQLQKDNDLSNDLDKFHVSKEFVCDVCAFQTRTQSELKTHMTSHQDKNRKAEKRKTPVKRLCTPKTKHTKTVNSFEYNCDICAVTASKLYELRQHMRCHVELENCDVCHKTFRHVAKHVREVHTNERPFGCKLCDLAFKARSNLKNHMKIHAEPSVCPICHKKLPNMERHLQWHKRDKPAPRKCLQCNKMFTTKQSLQEHIHRIHEKMPLGKLYRCKLCNLNFIRNRDLRRHSYIHYSGKIFTCDFPNCNEMFKKACRLLSHKMVHNDSIEANFACNLCDKNYLRQTALNKHQKKAHAESSKTAQVDKMINSIVIQLK